MFKQKTWFTKLLLSYIPIFIVLVFLLSAVFFIFANYMTQSQTRKSNEMFMEQAMSNIDQVLRQIDQNVLRELNYNDGLNGFYFADSGDRYNGVALPASRLESLKSGMSQIDSAYLYRFSDGKVLSGSVIVPVELFGDAAFIKRTEAEGVPTEWQPVREYRENTGDPARSVISIVRKAPLLTGNRGFIVVNVNVATLKKQIDAMSYSHYSYIRVEDTQGNPINATGQAAVASPLAAASLKSSYTGLTMQVGLRESGFTFVFSSLYLLWTVITVVMLVLGVLWIVRVSKRNYRPVEAILRQVHTSAQQKATSGKDEFHFIQDAITKLIDQSNEFEQKHREDLMYRKQLFFMDLLQGTKPVHGDAWREQLAVYRLPAEFDALQMAVIEIDKHPQFAELYNQRDQSLLKFALKSVVLELATKHGAEIWAEWIDVDRLGVLHFLPGGEHADPDRGQDRPAIVQYEELHMWVKDHLHFTVTIGLSSSAAGAEDVPLAYEEAVTALKYKTVLGLNRVIYFLEVKPKSDIDVYNRLQAVRSIVVMYKQGNAEWRSAFEQLIRHLQEEHAAEDDIVITLNYFNYQLNQAMKEFNPGYTEHWETSAYPQLITLLDRFELLSELCELYLRLLDEEFRRIAHIRESSSNRTLIREIQQFIEAHLGDPDLSLNMIGDRFDLNDKQVSQLVKDELGEKFVEYLARLRIQHAKRLLEETEESIQSISLQVGYVHSLSFIRMFKKMMQMTPGDYRKQIRAK
ncbi:helix-turn-helix domain-containing protein [Paenibacillus koleovorans]|uniref:helix-turn-helix domain-containing protein n=1 Tax=Paenibacillus koleovorans TaxID=121608 RepID=UPI000FDB8E64|nr:helix-turn-helix domain-containing protein [Paenibacillus koleovorans]